MNEKMNFIVGLYPRVSTEDQSRYGHSLDEQEESMKKLCDFKCYTIYKIYREEGGSAKSMDRPKFQEMINDLKSGKINKIIVYKLYRLTRSIQDLESICKLIEETKLKLNHLKQANKNINSKEKLKLYTNIFQLENMSEKMDCGTNLAKNKNQS